MDIMRTCCRPTTFVRALFCFLALVFGLSGNALLASSPVLRPAGSTPPPSSTSAAQVIGVGEPVTGLLGPAVPEMAFEVTAPSDGTLVIHLTGDIYLQFEDVFWVPMWRSPSVRSTVGTLEVAAGQTYLFWVGAPLAPWDYGDHRFVLTTSMESGPVTLPAACEIPPPGGDWICVDGGWVPPGHPLAITDPPSSFPTEPPTAPPPPLLPGPAGCASVQPATTWLCVNGGWVPPDHPLDQSAPANPTQPTPPSALPPGCTTPDPFRGIPGLVGVCVSGGWIPLGHPLAR